MPETVERRKRAVARARRAPKPSMVVVWTNLWGHFRLYGFFGTIKLAFERRKSRG